MREIVYKLDEAKSRAEKLKGIQVRFKINKGRNKFVFLDGAIEDVFPAVFTVRAGEDIKTFPYSDLLTKNVRIFPLNKE